MSSIPPPRDDQALPPLRRPSPSATAVTAPTAPRTIGDHRPPRQATARRQPPAPPVPRGAERRRGERRRMQIPVILDTRGRHERRTRQRRAAGTATAPAGWDAYA